MKMPGVLCQENVDRCSLGASSRHPPRNHSPVFPDSESGIEDIGDREFSWPPSSPFTLPVSTRVPRGTPVTWCSDGGEEISRMRRHWERRNHEEWNGDTTLRSLLENRSISLSRSDLVIGRRLSLEPPVLVRSRSRSQPPAVPHSAPEMSSINTREHLHSVAEAALQNTFTACALPAINVIQDASQGDSNFEDGQHHRLKQSFNENRIDSPISPSKIPSTKSISVPLALNSYPPVLQPSLGDKDNHDLPTDLSDNVDSDPEKEKILGPIADMIVCPTIATHHVGREVASAVYGLPIDTLFTLLFTNSKFMLDLHTARKTYDVVVSPWQSNPETNQKIRQVTYTLTLPTNSFGPKVSHVTETQVISSYSKPSECYSIDAEASNSGIPYADSFFVSNHWCLTRESANETRLTLWSQVKYKKNVWGFMKNVIDKNAFSGMESLMSDINASLLLEVDRSNLKRTKRRRRRAGSKGNEIGDSVLHVPSPIAKIIDSHKSTQIPSRKLTLPSVSLESTTDPIKSTVKSVTMFFLCALLVVNAFLYYRLYDLEERVVNNVSFKGFGLDSSIFKFSSSLGHESLADEWVQILRQQESLHAEELERWRKAVMEAADYLRKAEESLRNLHASIPSKQTSKMQSLLQQLQVLQQMQELKKNSHQPKSQVPEDADRGTNVEIDPSSRPKIHEL